MGLINGMNLPDRWLVGGVNVLLLLTMFVVDSRPLRDRARRMEITLDTVHADDAALVADLERRLGGRVIHHVVNEVDYVRDTMIVDVRYRVEPRVAQADYAQTRYDQQHYDQSGFNQAQYSQPAVQPAPVQPAGLRPGAVQPAAVQPAAVRPAAVRPAAPWERSDDDRDHGGHGSGRHPRRAGGVPAQPRWSPRST